MSETSVDTCACGHAWSEHGEDGCYTFLFDPEELARYCACRVDPNAEGTR